LTQQPPASPDQPTQQDQPGEPAQPQGGETGVASEPAPPDQPELPEQPAAAPPPPPPAPAAPPKKRRVGLIVTLTALVALAVVAVGAFLLLSVLREELPQVGDCMTDGATADDMEVVACDSGDAAWSVIGSDGTWTRGDFDVADQGEVCEAFPETAQALWVTSATSVASGTEGEVICLAPLAPGTP
jgi:hypothetical protein